MKAHFLISESPQKFDQSIQALCGAKVRNPEPVLFLADPRHFTRSLNDCSKCFDRLCEESQGRRYLYGVIEGEEAMHSGDTLEKIEKVVSKHSKFTQSINSAPDGKSEIAATENR